MNIVVYVLPARPQLPAQGSGGSPPLPRPTKYYTTIIICFMNIQTNIVILLCCSIILRNNIQL